MVLYHGSKHIIERPEYGLGNMHNDYGRAFYCTNSYELAAEWAVGEMADGFVNEYELDTEGLTILDLTAPEYSVLNWLTILLENRTFEINNDIAAAGRDYLMKNHRIEYRSHDIIVGWRADDSYFSFARAFLNNTISLEQLSEAMTFGNLGIQYALMSKKAYFNIKYNTFHTAKCAEYYPSKYERDMNARNDYRMMTQNTDIGREQFLIDLVRTGRA